MPAGDQMAQPCSEGKLPAKFRPMCIVGGVHTTIRAECATLKGPSSSAGPDELIALAFAMTDSRDMRAGLIPIDPADYAGLANHSRLYRVERGFNLALGVCVNGEHTAHTHLAPCFDSLAVDAMPSLGSAGHFGLDARVRARQRAL